MRQAAARRLDERRVFRAAARCPRCAHLLGLRRVLRGMGLWLAAAAEVWRRRRRRGRGLARGFLAAGSTGHDGLQACAAAAPLARFAALARSRERCRPVLAWADAIDIDQEPVVFAAASLARRRPLLSEDLETFRAVSTLHFARGGRRRPTATSWSCWCCWSDSSRAAQRALALGAEPSRYDVGEVVPGLRRAGVRARRTAGASRPPRGHPRQSMMSIRRYVYPRRASSSSARRMCRTDLVVVEFGGRRAATPPRSATATTMTTVHRVGPAADGRVAALRARAPPRARHRPSGRRRNRRGAASALVCCSTRPPLYTSTAAAMFPRLCKSTRVGARSRR